MEIDHTKVVCAVYGPKPRQDVAFSDHGTVLCDLRYAKFARRERKEKGGQQEDEEKALSLLVLQVCTERVALMTRHRASLPDLFIEDDVGADVLVSWVAGGGVFGHARKAAEVRHRDLYHGLAIRRR